MQRLCFEIVYGVFTTWEDLIRVGLIPAEDTYHDVISSRIHDLEIFPACDECLVDELMVQDGYRLPHSFLSAKYAGTALPTLLCLGIKVGFLNCGTVPSQFPNMDQIKGAKGKCCIPLELRPLAGPVDLHFVADGCKFGATHQ